MEEVFLYPPFRISAKLFGEHIFFLLWGIWIKRNNRVFRGLERSWELVRFNTSLSISVIRD